MLWWSRLALLGAACAVCSACGSPRRGGGTDSSDEPAEGGDAVFDAPDAADAGPDATGGYTEPECTLVDLGDVRAGYTTAGWYDALLTVLDRRYPYGLDVIRRVSNPTQLDMFVDQSDWMRFSFSVSTAVHEEAHVWDFNNRTGTQHPFFVRSDLTLRIPIITTFPRSEILPHHVDPATDRYDEVYLTGFSGTQGFDTLLDEYNAYTHSLATDYCVRDLISPFSVSARDGILTMMYYVELYLMVARTQHAAVYTRISTDLAFQAAILTIWDRAEFYLRLSEGMRTLGISDGVIRTWTYDPVVLEEITRIRALAGP